MTRRLLPLLHFALFSFVALGDTPSRDSIKSEYRWQLLDLHGGAMLIREMAAEYSRKGILPMRESAFVLLEIADDESFGVHGRQKALTMFACIAPFDEYVRLDPFYSSTNKFLRESALLGILDLGFSNRIVDKLVYARTRLDWMSEHVDFQRDSWVFNSYFQSYLHYSNPTDAERATVLDFFRKEATNARFARSVDEADMLLMRYDPAWPTNEARRAMMEKWKDDPGIHEKTRALWDKALAAFNGTNAADYATAGAPGSSEADEPLMPEPAAPDSVPVFRDGAPVVPDESSEPIREPASSPFHLARIAGTTALLAALTAVIFFQRKLHRHTESKDLNSNK